MTLVLTVAGFLTTVGFVAWILGYLFNLTGVAVIGGVLVFGVGVMVTSDGLAYKTGETHVAGNDNVTEIENEYQNVQTPTRMPLGILVMLLGGALVLHSIENAG